MLLEISIPCGWVDPSELWTLLYYVDRKYALVIVVVDSGRCLSTGDLSSGCLCQKSLLLIMSILFFCISVRVYSLSSCLNFLPMSIK
jgi:hypothetical protein